jgi:hypothetical protein
MPTREKKTVATIQLVGLDQNASTWVPASRTAFTNLVSAWLDRATPGQPFTLTITKTS